uniref:extracellular calcium-sensing receptor-like n=1 Tax=Myxine glutinosa TaxID=7769 RepID=UPI003590236C
MLTISRFNIYSFQSVMTMIYAVDEINRNSSILPNTSLGYVIYDSCFNMQKTLTAALSFLGQKFSEDLHEVCPIHAVIGESGSQHSLTIARFFALFLIPQISYFASCRCLSDKQQFPSFLRTMPSDAFQSIAIARMVLHFGWIYIGTIQNNDDYGREGIAQFIVESEDYGLCFAFQEVLPQKEDENEIKRLGEMLRRNITKKQWIASESWIDSSVISAQNTINMFQGTIGFALSRGHIPGLHDFLINLRPRILNTFGCTWSSNDETSQLCTGSENLEAADTLLTDVSRLRVTYNTYMAVYAIANALHNLQSCVQMEGILLNITCGDIPRFEPWQVPRSVCSDPCKPSTRKVRQKGEPLCCFDCIPCGDGTYSNITDSSNCYFCPEMFWSTKGRNGCVRMRIEFLDYSDPISVILLACTALGLVFTMLIGVMMYLLHEMRMGIGLLLLALTGCFVCIINFVGEPTDATCSIREIRFVTFSMLVCSLICLAFVPAYASTQGKYSTASEIFALLGSAFGILSCIFVPKCYNTFKLNKRILYQRTYEDEPESSNQAVGDIELGTARCPGQCILATAEERVKEQAGCRVETASVEMPALK